jgi:hypothetical protein
MEDLTEAPVIGKKGTFPATVAKVIDDYKLVINKGSEHGIREGQRMLVYNIDDEDIKDPKTGESLGYLELVRGTGKIILVQEKISILESDAVNKPYLYPNSLTLSATIIKDLIDQKLIEQKRKPFDNPQVGDQVKPI